MKLQLTRPLAFFDIESTGANPQTDRIIEISITILRPNGMTNTYNWLVNPGIPIPDGAIAIHGITNEAVKDMPLFKEVAGEIVLTILDCDLAGFNSNNFDIPMLVEEMNRAEIVLDLTGVNFVDAGILFKIIAPRTLSAAVLIYNGKEHVGAHGASADVQATIDVLLSMLDKHDELPVTVPELALKSNYDKPRTDLAGKFKYNNDSQIVYSFGKYINQRFDIDLPYLMWMLKSKDESGQYKFAEDTRKFICKIADCDMNGKMNGGAPSFK